jgi:hypothetical protein
LPTTSGRCRARSAHAATLLGDMVVWGVSCSIGCELRRWVPGKELNFDALKNRDTTVAELVEHLKNVGFQEL